MFDAAVTSSSTGRRHTRSSIFLKGFFYLRLVVIPALLLAGMHRCLQDLLTAQTSPPPSGRARCRWCRTSRTPLSSSLLSLQDHDHSAWALIPSRGRFCAPHEAGPSRRKSRSAATWPPRWPEAWKSLPTERRLDPWLRWRSLRVQARLPIPKRAIIPFQHPH